MAEDSTKLTVGDAYRFLADGETLGYADDISLQINFNYLKYKTGIPRYLVRKTMTEMGVVLGVNLKELRPENWVLGIGLDSSILSSIEGDTKTTYWHTNLAEWTATTAIATNDYCEPTTLNGKVYKCSVAGTTDATEPVSWPTTVGSTVTDDSVTWICENYAGEAGTFASLHGGSVSYVQLTGHNLDSTDLLRVYNSDYTTLYTADDTQYIYDRLKGVVLHCPLGSIGSVDACKFVYKYTEIDRRRISFNPDTMTVLEVDIHFDHRTIMDSRHIVFDCFKMQGSGFNCAFDPVNWSQINLTLNAINDSARSNYEYGRIFFEDAV